MAIHTDRVESTTAFQGVKETGPSPAHRDAYADKSLNLTGRSSDAGLVAQGFPSTATALRSLGLDPRPPAGEPFMQLPPREPGHHGSDVGHDMANRRHSAPFKSDTVSDDQADQWVQKYNDGLDRPGGWTGGTLMSDLNKAAAAAGTNPDGSPRVSIGIARDQEGTTHFYAMFNENKKQLEANQKAVRAAQVNYKSKDGTSAAIADIGGYSGGFTDAPE
jgi:hypothetical protein